MQDWEADVPILTEDEQRQLDEAEHHHDGQLSFAEQQATRWFRLALIAMLGMLASVAWHHFDKMEVVEPFVLVVEKTDDGQVTLIDPPIPMKEFLFPAEAVMSMLRRFVIDRQRLGEDRVEMEDRRMDVEAAVCGPAAQQIVIPPKRDAALVALNGVTAKPTPSPQTYRLSWQESWYDKMGHHKGDHTMMADITVVKRELNWSQRESIEVWRRQPMGLCISSFLMHEESHLKEAF